MNKTSRQILILWVCILQKKQVGCICFQQNLATDEDNGCMYNLYKRIRFCLQKGLFSESNILSYSLSSFEHYHFWLPIYKWKSKVYGNNAAKRKIDSLSLSNERNCSILMFSKDHHNNHHLVKKHYLSTLSTVSVANLPRFQNSI